MSLKNLNLKINKFLLDEEKTLKKDILSFYWTKKDSNILLALINQFVKKNNKVLDPFLGSGQILFSQDSSKKKFSIIGCELNQMPLEFINLNLKEIKQSNQTEFANKIKNFIKKYSFLYEYDNFYFKEKVLLDKIIFDRKEDLYPIIKEFHLTNGVKKFILNEKISKKIFLQNCDIYFERFYKYEKIIKNYDINLLENTRIAIKKDTKLSHIFNPINFFVLNKYKEEFVKDNYLKNLLASILHLCRLSDKKSQSQFPYWIPKKDIVERNVLNIIQKKLNFIKENKEKNTLDLKKIKTFSEINNKEKNILIFNKPIQNITTNEIPDNSIDVLITDPPYFDQVAYSEYLKIWEYFCNYKSNLDDEIIVSNRVKFAQRIEDYKLKLKNSFILINKKLKKNSFALIFFKDSKPKNIYIFLKIMEESGFIFLRSLHVQGKKFTYKQNSTKDTTVEGECIFFFKKNSTFKINKKKLLKRESNLNDVVENFVKNYFKNKNNASLAELYDNGLLQTLYESNLLSTIKSSKTIVDILKSKFSLLKERKYS